jgi:hypothetical protein
VTGITDQKEENMPQQKELYDAAVAQLKAIADGQADPREAPRLLKDVNVYVVALRRDKSGLKAQNERLEREVDALRRRLERYDALHVELEEARSLARKTERRVEAWVAMVRDEAQALADLQARREGGEAAAVSGEGTFTVIKVKCLGCSLHYCLYTCDPRRHTLASLHCPECGQHAGHFLTWAEPGRGLICQHVPGTTPPMAVGAPPPLGPGSGKEVAGHSPTRGPAGRRAGEQEEAGG